MPEIRRTFGRYLRELRQSRSLGLREVSRQVIRQPGARGLSPAYLSLIERGHVEIPQQHILRHLSVVLGVDDNLFAAIAQGLRIVTLSDLLEQSSLHHAILVELRSGTARYPAIISAIIEILQASPGGFQGLRAIHFQEGKVDGFLSFDPKLRRCRR